MKKIFIALFVLFTAVTLLASAFSDGFRDGYKAGYCYGEVFCIAPLPPIPPFPRIGENTYQDGYNRGFLAGLNDKR